MMADKVLKHMKVWRQVPKTGFTFPLNVLENIS